MDISIYIKSHFRGNPRGAGEAAAIIEYIDKNSNRHNREQHIKIEKDTKNALMLKICISALKILLKPCTVSIHIDCDYIINTHKQGWVKKWQQNGWKKANQKSPSNIEDWKQFYTLLQKHKVQFESYNNKYDTELENILGE